MLFGECNMPGPLQFHVAVQAYRMHGLCHAAVPKSEKCGGHERAGIQQEQFAEQAYVLQNVGDVGYYRIGARPPVSVGIHDIGRRACVSSKKGSAALCKHRRPMQQHLLSFPTALPGKSLQSALDQTVS